MKTWLRGIAIALVVALGAAAMDTAPAVVHGSPYDIDAYLNIRQAWGARWLADESAVVYLTNITGTAQVWKVDAAGGYPEQLTYFDDAIDVLAPSPTDANVVLIGKAAGGDERTQLYLMDAAGARIERITEPATATVNFGCWSRDGRQIAYASNERDEAFFDVYVLDVATRARRPAMQADGYLEAMAFSPSGERLVVSRWESNYNNNLYLVDLTKDAEPLLLTEHAGWATYAPVRWPVGPNSAKGFYVVSNLSGEFAKVGFLDVGKRLLKYQDNGPWDTEALEFSRNGLTEVYVNNVQGLSRMAIIDVKAEALMPPPKLPAGVIYDIEASRSGSHLVMTFTAANEPADVYVNETATGEVRRLTRSSTGGVPRASFVDAGGMVYRTADELNVPAFVYLPPGLAAGEKAPCIIYAHGGPEGQERPTFSYLFQYFVNRGFAIVAPNVRGSTGYGKAYSHLDDGERRMNSVADLADAVRFIQKNMPQIDGERIALLGGSYGGFMVLAGLTEYPDLFAAGVSIVGIANFETFLEQTAPYRRTIREAEYGSLADRALLRRISPIHKATAIRAPLMMIHGANDPRVPLTEAEQMAAALRAAGRPVELLVYPDEGHGLRKLANKRDAYPKMAAFLERYLKP